MKQAMWAVVGLAGAVACSTAAADLGGNTQAGESDGGGNGGSGNSGGSSAGGATAGNGGSGTAGKGTGGGASVAVNGKLDLLIVLDTSISIAAQHGNLAKAVPDFVERTLAETPGATDVHVGLVTTSLGGHGGDLCDLDRPGAEAEAAADNGMLIGSRPRFEAAALRHPTALPTTAEGFVQWTGSDSAAALGETVAAMVEAAGTKGCGFESPLEAMYRFLSDPEPPLELVTAPCSSTNPSLCVFKQGVNEDLLAQREAFLRPDSAVAIAIFTDEDDCSVAEVDQNYYVTRSDVVMPRATSVCATNPNDRCCVSCVSPTPTGCTPDPECSINPTLPAQLHQPNLRCFNQKGRFGLDFLYPVERYTNALTQSKICTRDYSLRADFCDAAPELEPSRDNPLFAEVNGTRRSPSSVYILGVLGVPRADLLAPSGGYRTPAQLTQSGTWDVILGDPTPPNGAAPIPPTNQLMVESVSPRGGNDGQGVPLAPPSAGTFANPQNSHEHQQPDTLQAACLVSLETPIDCSQQEACTCSPGANAANYSIPECQESGTDQYTTTQTHDSVSPTPRQLQLLKSLGNNAVTTSLCAPQFTDTSREDFGYRESAVALSRELKRSLPD